MFLSSTLHLVNLAASRCDPKLKVPRFRSLIIFGSVVHVCRVLFIILAFLTIFQIASILILIIVAFICSAYLAIFALCQLFTLFCLIFFIALTFLMAIRFQDIFKVIKGKVLRNLFFNVKIGIYLVILDEHNFYHKDICLQHNHLVLLWLFFLRVDFIFNFLVDY